MNTKKVKTYHYNKDWENDYFFIMVKNKCCCLICNTSIALPKKGNVERHFRTLHNKYEIDYPQNSELRKVKIIQLKTGLAAQQSVFTKQTSKSKAATIASLRVSHILAKTKKPFSDGVIFKNAFLEAGESLFSDFGNKAEILSAINDLQLSRNSVTRRVEQISLDLKEQLKKDIEDCSAFSLQVDESTDVVDISQLIIFIRMIFIDFSTKEELLTIIPLKGKTRGEDIFSSFKTFLNNTQLPLFKLVSITSDGAPAMVGRYNGFINLCRADDDFPDFLSYHCIIHQQTLCAKVLNMADIMTTAFKIANSIRARSLQRRLFKLQVEESDHDGHTELLMHTDVRWLSRGKFLQRFRDLINEIKVFLIDRGDEYKQLEDEKWLLDLAFLTDITSKLNDLNLELQGKDKSIFQMISSVNAFKQKLTLLVSKLEKNNLTYFPNLMAQVNSSAAPSYDPNIYITEIKNINSEFDRRFQDFKKLDGVILFMTYPFATDIQVEITAEKLALLFEMDIEKLETEIIQLQNDVLIKSRKFEENIWKYVSTEKYPFLRKCSEKLHACFGSTYLCESAFSQLKIIKSKYRINLTDEHLDSCLRNCITTYTPNYKKIVDVMQCRTSTAAGFSK